MIEVLVVVAIVAILAGILLPVLLAARTTARKKQTLKEITDIAGALTNYYLDRDEYPPDTADWSAWHAGESSVLVPDERSIHRYLGLLVEVEDEDGEKTGRTYGPYLNIRAVNVLDLEAGVGKYVDPWKGAYQMDAVHTDMVDDAPTRVSAPYYYTDPSELGSAQALDFKVVSHGPDKEAAPYYPFDPVTDEGRKWARDDIRSW